jgi:spore germination protein YaaH
MKKILITVILFGFFMPFFASHTKAASLPIDVWLPYWKKEAGIQETIPNLKPIWRLHPFAFEVQPDGTLVDAWNMDEVATDDFFLDVRKAKVKIVPTIAWHSGSQILNTLSSSTARAAHIDGIMAHVDAYKFDGVDIDYEAKPAESRDYFSKFLAELSKKLKAKKKTLSCTIEARTPLTSRFTVIPKDIEYANDYVAINKYCDEVNIMAYDQRNVDILLNAKKGKTGYYFPVADKEWVEKVIKETIKTISPKKIRLGVPTFGYDYVVTPVATSTATSTLLSSSTATSTYKETGIDAPGVITLGKYKYDRIGSLTYKDFKALPIGFDGTTYRNTAGELSAIYYQNGVTHFASISDATAIAQKVALAKKYKLQGVAIWTANGENDPKLWSVLK